MSRQSTTVIKMSNEATYRLLVDIRGDSPNEAWNHLLDLFTKACEFKRDNGGNVDWPYFITSTESGNGEIRVIEDKPIDKSKSNMMTYDEIITVVNALKEGKQVQIEGEKGKWDDITNPALNFGMNNYRVKPVPREFWINYYHKDGREIYSTVHQSRFEADRAANMCHHKVIHVREVLE